MPRSPDTVVRDFCAAWSRLDLEEIMAFFTEDAVYHNMPGPALVGKAAVRRGIERFLRDWSATQWDVLNVAVSGNVVFAERLDRTDAGGKHVDLPCTGVFELDGERIRVWRDYFDMGTYVKAMNAG